MAPSGSRPKRLLNVKNYKLVSGRSVTDPYAILSHRWGADEVLHKEWPTHVSNRALQQKMGYVKVVGACARARKDRIAWLWYPLAATPRRNP
ncbi:hypothetical protein LTR10_010615 [Elasticomyces elasticus]|nr:hypothetical protein LTR10_010615 [Elasticomyces elasticus]KAK4968221.1 hypothetical protein LTR42_009504 [Elasticomyces elasticus]